MSTVEQLNAVAALMESDSDEDQLQVEPIDVTLLFIEEVQSDALDNAVSALFKNNQQVLPGTSDEVRFELENTHNKSANQSIKLLSRARRIGMPDAAASDNDNDARSHKFAPIFGESGFDSDATFAFFLKKVKKARNSLLLNVPTRPDWKCHLVSSIRAETRGPEGRARYGITSRPSEDVIMTAVEAFWRSWSDTNAKSAKKSRENKKNEVSDLKKQVTEAKAKMRAAQDELDSAKIAHEGQLAAAKADGDAAVAKVRSDAAEKFSRRLTEWNEKEWELRERVRIAESKADAAEAKCKTYEEMMHAWKDHAAAVDRGSPKRKRTESPESERFGGSSLPSYDSL